MDASEYLHRVVSARKRAEGLEFQHKRLEQAANNVPGGTFDEPRASSGQRGQAPFVRFIDRILEAEKAAEAKHEPEPEPEPEQVSELEVVDKKSSKKEKTKKKNISAEARGLTTAISEWLTRNFTEDGIDG